jgi:hypothetical protein
MPGYRPDSDEDDRKKHQHQILITPDRLLAQAIDEDLEKDLPNLIKMANQASSEGKGIREALTEALPRVDTREFTVRDGLLLYQQKLWVPDQDHLRTRLIREMHDQPSTGHQGEARTLEAIQRSYSWPGLRTDMERYLRNCHTCRRSKAPRDRQNGLLQPLPVLEQRWKDISMDFITGLPLSTEGFNTILTVIDRLSKERHYIPCTAGEEGTSAEETAKLLLR